MPKPIITTDEVKFIRLIARKDTEFSYKYSKFFSWYPVRQNIDFGRVAQIYADAVHRYGREEFEKYAFRHKLNKKHTFNYGDVKAILDNRKANEDFDAGNTYRPKLPDTTNAEYGLFRPTRVHYCTAISKRIDFFCE